MYLKYFTYSVGVLVHCGKKDEFIDEAYHTGLLKLKMEQGGRPCPSLLQGFLQQCFYPGTFSLGSLADGQLSRSLIPRLEGKPGYRQAS